MLACKSCALLNNIISGFNVNFYIFYVLRVLDFIYEKALIIKYILNMFSCKLLYMLYKNIYDN